MLDEVWACLRQAEVRGDNAMRSRDLGDGTDAVEVGVEVGEALPVRSPVNAGRYTATGMKTPPSYSLGGLPAATGAPGRCLGRPVLEWEASGRSG
jgi:hypothetical protein